MSTTLLLSDVPDNSLQIISEHIFRYTSPLLKLYYDPPGIETVDVLGAGTFVNIEGIFGILTAQHVIKSLTEDSALGLVLLKTEDNFHLQREAFKIFEIATPLGNDTSPDLAFIQLSQDAYTKIAAHKDFYSLTKFRDELLNKTPSIDDGLWSACGTPKENIRLEDSIENFDYVIATQLFCGFGEVEIEDSMGDFDYFRMLTEYHPTNHTPQSAKGMSGGGLWQIPVTIYPDNRIKAKRFLLSGVTFWRSINSSGKKYIRCHGRNSIYRQAYNAILEKCNS